MPDGALLLVAKNGPLAGAAVRIADGVTIGGPSIGLAADHPGFRVRAADGGYTLQSLDRHTSVFVNGLPLTARPLQARDELHVADSLFVVQPDDSETTDSGRGLSACDVRTAALQGARAELEVSFDEALLHAGGRTTTREARDLLTLMRIGAAMSSVQGLAAIDAALAAFVLDVVPADRVVLSGGEGGPSEVRSAWAPTNATERVATVVDPDLLERVASERLAMLMRGKDGDVLVAPTVAFGRATGCIWVQIPRGASVDEGHVRLLLVVGALMAVAREHVLESRRLQESNELLQAEINLEHNMVGRSRPMRTLFDRIARIARTESTILLRGESGTGKELVARAVHRNSVRSDRQFVAINCAAITETLLESELFGHEKGAFTGAVGMKKGKLELADGGTLFLDEIGELPLTLQAKLLRALQEREFERVGGTRPVRVDFRLIAATNRDLEGAIAAGTFRQDLFYRLNVVTLLLPPLRERKDDLSSLADYFVRKHAPRCGRRVQGIARDALDRLAKHNWPGNVRELENVIEHALALGTGDQIGADDLPPGLGDENHAGPSSSLDYHATIEEKKRELIVRAFERAENNHAGAARLLGVHPNYLHRLLRNFNLRGTTSGNPERK